MAGNPRLCLRHPYFRLPVNIQHFFCLRMYHIDPGTLIVKDCFQGCRVLHRIVLGPEFQEKGTQYLRDEYQCIYLFLGPVTVDTALVKAHKSLELPFVVNGALQHGLDSLGLQYLPLLRCQCIYVTAVKYTALVEIALVSALQIICIGHMLKITSSMALTAVSGLEDL